MRPIDADFAKERIKKSDLTNREKIAFLLLLEDVPMLAPPPNDPLTLEELRKMDGEPVWVIPISNVVKAEYALVNVENEWLCASDTDFWEFSVYGVGILAYRRRPEEGT